MLAMRFAASPLCLLALSFAMPAAAFAQNLPSTSTTSTSSDGSSTGVGNAGSFGIGSGTSDSISTATATSNGVQDSSTDNSVDSSTSINTISAQDLQASTTNNQIRIDASPSATSPTLQTGANTVSGGSFANYVGILNNGWNSAPGGTAQAATSIAVNGNFGRPD